MRDARACLRRDRTTASRDRGGRSGEDRGRFRGGHAGAVQRKTGGFSGRQAGAALAGSHRQQLLLQGGHLLLLTPAAGHDAESVGTTGGRACADPLNGPARWSTKRGGRRNLSVKWWNLAAIRAETAGIRADGRSSGSASQRHMSMFPRSGRIEAGSRRSRSRRNERGRIKEEQAAARPKFIARACVEMVHLRSILKPEHFNPVEGAVRSR